MEPHFGPAPSEPFRPSLPSLPIVTPDAPRKTQVEKYGFLFYLGIAGLFVLLGLVGYFAYGMWSLRGVWANIYTLHSNARSEAERVQAAYALSQDPRVTQREYWEICLRKPLPPLARYLMAEAVNANTVAADPRAYALVVAKSEGWPGWLRVQLTRPLAYAAADGVSLPREPLLELSAQPDPAVALIANFALASVTGGDQEALARIESVARADGPYRDFARDLLEARKTQGETRRTWLDKASLWLRRNHPDSARLWEGWEVQGQRIAPVPAPAPNLQPQA
ncbi:MAG: hypothetical protein P4L84_27420 [Isosphaeraceae bacterium]|nr:hypothetical protein [Isosphaeraceae bacterium]